MKKIVSLLLVLILVLGLGLTVSAAEVGNTITVKNAQAGETYRIYKMLDLEVSADKKAYSYKVNASWTNFFANGGAGAAYITTSDLGYVTWVDAKRDEPSMIAFGKAAAAFVETNGITAAKPDQTPAADGDITFSGLEPGYYLITSTNGTKAIVDTTPANPDPAIAEKNVDPILDKTVEEDSNYGNMNDAQIGETVKFHTAIHAKSGAKGYVLHDQMKGMDFDNNVVITVGNTTATLTAKAEGMTTGYDYEVVTAGLGDECTFHIVFSQDYLDTITGDTSLNVAYSATLNKDAVIGGEGNPNSTKLDWGSSSHTEWDTTKTFTWEANVIKYGNGDRTNLLAGAQFVVLDLTENKVAKFENGKITGWLDIPTADAEGKIALTQWDAASVQATGADGKISVRGLDAGVNYSLREVKAPDGYNLLGEDQPITITTTEDANNNTMTQVALTVWVNNQTGNELPSTGGMGTTVFYVVGSVLLLGAAVLLITRRRMRAE